MALEKNIDEWMVDTGITSLKTSRRLVIKTAGLIKNEFTT